MPTARKQVKRSPVPKKKTIPKKTAKTPSRRSKAAAPKKTARKATIPIFRPKHTLYIDSSFFFPPDSTEGYIDDSQAGRYTTTLNGILQAPVMLPVGATMSAVTLYYKNTSTEAMPVAFL